MFVYLEVCFWPPETRTRRTQSRNIWNNNVKSIRPLDCTHSPPVLSVRMLCAFVSSFGPFLLHGIFCSYKEFVAEFTAEENNFCLYNTLFVLLVSFSVCFLSSSIVVECHCTSRCEQSISKVYSARGKNIMQITAQTLWLLLQAGHCAIPSIFLSFSDWSGVEAQIAHISNE